jgi:N-acetylmuramoyl-L-alanine amidase
MDKRGFADIGYHFFINLAGVIFEGRPLEVRGAHVKGRNNGAIGVSLAGNFEVDHPTSEQVDALFKLVDFLTHEFRVSHLAGHDVLNPALTQCPGDNLSRLLPDLAEQARLHLLKE